MAGCVVPFLNKTRNQHGAARVLLAGHLPWGVVLAGLLFEAGRRDTPARQLF